MDEFENYYEDLTQDDLTAADVRRISESATVQTLQAIMQSTALAESAKQAALARAEEQRPGFLKLYSNPEVCAQMLEKRPRISRAIIAAESGQGSDYLDELYGIFYDTARGMVASTDKPSNASPETVSGSLSTSTSRQRIIERFEKQHGDVLIDIADDSDEGKRTRRY